MYFFVFLIVASAIFSSAQASNASRVTNFQQAKTYLKKHLDLYESKTIYCSCDIISKKKKLTVDLKSCGYRIQGDSARAERVEWEHVVPAEAFGQSFSEWRIGAESCKKGKKAFKGRKCAETNAEFSKMESDVYNLFPEIGELNGLRSNYSMAALSGTDKFFGDCRVKLADRKFEPQDSAKGIVARTYINFEKRYPGRGVVSEKNIKLFDAWDKMYPVTPLECKRWQVLASVSGYKHFFSDRCK